MPENDGSSKDTAIVIGEVSASEDDYDPEKFDVSVLVEDSDMEMEIPGLVLPQPSVNSLSSSSRPSSIPSQ